MLDAEPVKDGYGKVAELMSTHDEFAILRRFRHLNMKNLLYLQAELAHLEEEVQELAERDSQAIGLQFHGREWWSLAHGADDSSQEQWKKVLQLREKLEIYNNAMLKQAGLARLRGPSRYELRFLRQWLERPRMGNFPLLGIDRKSWDAEHEEDLVGLRERSRSDAFSSWVAETVVPSFHRFVGEKWKTPYVGQSGIYSYDDRWLSMLIFSISTMAASLICTGSILSLYYIQSDAMKIGFALSTCVIFALAMGLVSNASRAEIFSCSAAFAAIAVAFITSNNNTINNNGPCPCNDTVVS